jgi:Cobalamin synthesis protein cobW C-terminal domain
VSCQIISVFLRFPCYFVALKHVHAFQSKRPFLPHLLYEVLEAMLAKTSPPYNESIILRAKGFLWFANCPQLQGDFSLAGKNFTVLPGNPWWAEIDKADWPENLERDIAPLWHDPYGDRQQEIVIIGQSLDQEAITQSLEGCLVSEEDFAKGQEAWYLACNEAGDPFAEAWDAALQTAIAAHNQDHEHAHDYRSRFIFYLDSVSNFRSALFLPIVRKLASSLTR